MDAAAMKTIAITTSCQHCGRPVEDAMHLLLCDGCLDARLAQLEPTPAHAVGAAAFAAFERLAQPIAA
jgi:hypothetical protein